MGASLIGSALILVCPKLGRHHASRLALIVMCQTAQDGAARPVYYAGWRPIAAALGLSGSERTQTKRVSEILDHLVAAGAIEKVGEPAPGRNATYLLQVRHELPALHLVPDLDVNQDVGEDLDPAVDGGG